MGLKITGARRAATRLDRYRVDLQRETRSLLIQEARALAVEYGSATMPGPGFGEDKAERFSDRVEGDVRKVYASRQDPGSVFALLKIHAPHLAGAYWHAHKANKVRAAADIVRRANLPGGLDPADHRKARTGKKGGVPGPRKPVSLATEPQLRAFARKQRQLVGLAKAGWYCAAKGLGGRVRRTVANENGSRRSVEVFPPYVRRVARKFPGLGGALIRGPLQRPSVTIFSAVKHADAALPSRLREAAADRAQARLAASIRHAQRALNKGRRRAA